MESAQNCPRPDLKKHVARTRQNLVKSMLAAQMLSEFHFRVKLEQKAQDWVDSLGSLDHDRDSDHVHFEAESLNRHPRATVAG